MRNAKPSRPGRILCIDIGGHKIKALVQGATQPRKAPTGPKFTPERMLRTLRELARGWTYDGVAIGFPGLVGATGPQAESVNLGRGWVGFDFQRGFRRPVRWANDAALQALGSYDGGRMLFLGLGTGLGSALVTDRTVLTLELGDLRLGERTLGEQLGRRGLRRDGKKKWRRRLLDFLPSLQRALKADYAVLGGGIVRYVRTLPVGVRIGHNLTAFRGGVRMWELDPVSGKPLWTFL